MPFVEAFGADTTRVAPAWRGTAKTFGSRWNRRSCGGLRDVRGRWWVNTRLICPCRIEIRYWICETWGSSQVVWIHLTCPDFRWLQRSIIKVPKIQWIKYLLKIKCCSRVKVVYIFCSCEFCHFCRIWRDIIATFHRGVWFSRWCRRMRGVDGSNLARKRRLVG